ncbi:hypothetical protein ASD37_07675 [Mycobacterium sp. Root135]|nr:hypothetical protein ASD37_07675 [Mycobacterium sp. Root135]
MLGAVGLVIGSAFAAALAFGATALIVPGTGTHNILPPNAVIGYKENAADRYINVSGQPCTSTDGCNLVGVDYPASFFPLAIIPGWCPGLKCDTWDKSVGTGVTNLGIALNTALGPDPSSTDPIIIFGYSQGGAVVSQEMYNIADEDKDRISVVTIGNINNPLGAWSRLSFLPHIPFLNISFGPQLPTDIGIKSTNYSFEYDPVGDAPQYWGNPLAVLNALVALEYVHGYYLDPTTNSPKDSLPYGYDDGTLATAIKDAPKREHGDATFVLIPQQGALPLYLPVLDIGKQLGISGLVKPLVALLNPVTKLLVNLGYDRITNPGIARTLSILPFNPLTFNPVDFSVKFVAAIAQGIQDAIAGGASLTPAKTPATTLAARSAAPQTVEPVETKKVTQVSLNSSTPGTDVPQASGEKGSTDLDADANAKAAAEKAAADAKAAAEKDAADKAAAEAKAAQEKADADAKAAAAKAAKEKAADEKAAADKLKAAKEAAEKEQDAAAKAAADKAKEAADNAKAAGAAGDSPTKVTGTDTGTTAAPAQDTGAGDTEKQAA